MIYTSKVIVPDYFEKFSCKCGNCRTPCCDGWGINIAEHEYFKLIGIECSKKLRHRLDDAFVISDMPEEDKFATIQPNFLGMCPMLAEDGLCMLQKEKGEAAIPLICRVYPRSVKRYGKNTEICMSCSCEETVEIIISTTKPFTLHEIDSVPPFEGIDIYGEDEEKDRIRHKAISLISTDEKPIVERFRELGELVAGNRPEITGTRIEALSSLIGILKILCKRSKSIREYGEITLEFLGGDISDALTRFEKAEAHLYELIPEIEDYASRLICNHMLYESFPFVPDGGSPDSAYSALCTAVALLKLLCVCGLADTDKEHIREKFADIASFSNRFIEHSDFYKVCAYLVHPKGTEVFSYFAPLFLK